MIGVQSERCSVEKTIHRMFATTDNVRLDKRKDLRRGQKELRRSVGRNFLEKMDENMTRMTSTTQKYDNKSGENVFFSKHPTPLLL
jgi:hypothetical protein